MVTADAVAAGMLCIASCVLRALSRQSGGKDCDVSALH